jgi:hypothetical protein
MYRKTSLTGLLLTALALGCSGGSESQSGVVPGPGGGSTNLAGSFSGSAPNPGPDTVSMTESGTNGNLVTVAIQVTDTGGVFGAAFDVAYDPAFVEYFSWARGSLLESDGGIAIFQVTDVGGRVTVGASRIGTTSVDAVGSQSLILLTFRVIQAGSSTGDFATASLLEVTGATPEPIGGINWSGGSFSAN